MKDSDRPEKPWMRIIEAKLLMKLLSEDLMCFCPAEFSWFFPAMKNVWDTGADFIQPSFCFGFFGMDLKHKACHSERTLHIFAWGSWQQDTIFNYKASLSFAQLSLQSKWLQRCWPKVGPANLELELLRWVSLHWPRGSFRENVNETPGCDDQILDPKRFCCRDAV